MIFRKAWSDEFIKDSFGFVILNLEFQRKHAGIEELQRIGDEAGLNRHIDRVVKQNLVGKNFFKYLEVINMLKKPILVLIEY
jgi:hypothetical protein